MKKSVPLLALALAMLVVMGFSGPVSQGIVRLHVIANSDSEEDQRVKLLVRDEVLQTLQSLEYAQEGQDARAEVLSRGEELQTRVEALLRREGMDYGARLYFGDFPFPEKTYGDITYPEGDYIALRVVLGNGEGRNWWCVLFPPLCLTEMPKDQAKKPAKTEKGGQIRFRSAIADLFSPKS